MDSILLPTEIEFYIETMKPQDMENLGTQSWLEYHQRLQKLNQEAYIEASAVKEEHVKESLLSLGKLNTLIHEALLINIWKYKVLPQLLKLEPFPESTMIAYSILYHEAVCVSLLELATFHSSVCEFLQDSAIDLLDYCTGVTSRLLSINYHEATTKESASQELYGQRDNLSFEIGIKSISIIRYICENMDKLPLCVCSNIYTVYEIPSLFIEILNAKPWISEKDGRKMYLNGKWVDWDGEKLCPPETQVWLTLRHILLDPECANFYEMTDRRRAQFLKLSASLTPVLLDQLSPLIELKQWLSRVSFSNETSSKPRPILLENCLEIKENILRKTDGKWREIASVQVQNIFNNDKRHLMETAKILNEAYNTDLLEKFDVKNTVPCSRCGQEAIQRCSKCKQSWYCSRKCQVTHWPQHKEKCQENKCD